MSGRRSTPHEPLVGLPNTSRLEDRRPGFLAFHKQCWRCGAPDAVATCGACKTLRYCAACRLTGCSHSTGAAKNGLCVALRQARLAVEGRLGQGPQIWIPAHKKRKHAAPFFKQQRSESLQLRYFGSQSMGITDVASFLGDVRQDNAAFEAGWVKLHFQVKR